MTRQRALRSARWVFVPLTIAGAWWGFRGRWTEIGAAVAATGPLRLAGAVAVAAAGLVLTGLLWRLLLRGVGAEVAAREAAPVFFVGQLGKYVPGSVWSLAVQAKLGRRHGVPVRSSVAASALFLVVHTATGLLLGGGLVMGGALGGAIPDHLGGGWPLVALGVGAAALAPPLLRRLGERLAGTRFTWGGAALVKSMALMAVVWACYGASLLLLVPGPAVDWTGLTGAVAAFALAHAAGVLIVFAPAGVGAREAVLVSLLAPTVGLTSAAAVALISRLAHVMADFGVAGSVTVWALSGRSVGSPEPARDRA